MTERILDEGVFQSVRDIVYRKAGIVLGEGKQALVQARLAKRLRALGFVSNQEYLDYLLNDESGEEIVQLLDVISTNFTSFWREPQHFEHLHQELSSLAAKGLRKIRVWCAAASTGEEPYTLAMTCLDALGGVRHAVDLKILCTDISTRVLQACREGRYDTEKLEPLPALWRERWFRMEPSQPGVSIAGPELRACLSFARLNLMEVPYPMQGPFQVIFCRNVMIYFDVDGRRRIVNEARRLLQPGGLLYTGHSESLNGISQGFHPEKPSVYRRDGVGL